MNPQEQTLLLLRAALWGHTPDSEALPEGTDWQAILATAERQAVQGLVASAILRWVDDTRRELDDTIMRACLTYQFAAIKSNELVSSALGEVQAILKANGAQAGVLIKGQGVARYYRQPQLRMAGDIDLYTGEATNHIADILQPHAEAGSRDDSYPRHISLRWQGVEVELHRWTTEGGSSRRGRKLKEWAKEELASDRCRKALIGQTEVTVPSAMFDAVFIFHHLWRHLLWEGIGLRQLCDWAMVLAAEDIPPATLEQQLRHFGILREWRIFGHILTECLGLPRQRFPLYGGSCYDHWCARYVLRRILRLGNFGKAPYQHMLDTAPTGALPHRLHTACYIIRHRIAMLPLSPMTTLRNIRDFLVTSIKT